MTSRILVTIRPELCNVLIADSLPGPGPLTNTSTCRRPCSIALRTAFSAARCAANAVDFRDPVNPTVPALPQAIGLPRGSVSVIRVLLKVDWI